MITLLSTSDTDLRTAATCGADYRVANPSRILLDELPGLIDGADLVVVRILGGRRAWEEGLDAVLRQQVPVIVLSGELNPDPDLMALSTVPTGVAAQAHSYFVAGGHANLAAVHNFLSDTVLLPGLGFAPPVETPAWGVLERTPSGSSSESSGSSSAVEMRVGVLYYRAQHLAGNTEYVDTLCAAIERHGAEAQAVFCASLRAADDDLIAHLGTFDALIVTVLAAGGTTPATAGAGGDDEAWNVERLAALDIPILQGLCLTSSRDDWESQDDGVSPLDVASQVAVPEFDGRIITVPFSFKEFDDNGLP
ncbi:MAG: cobaltochelatase subunit CobN, partial [Gordonia sp. (in: high G+C Gram-positive bacteria)]|nr:cobaltochelatase subunit CobN [Gordonia sp. (in: high G+C Gram-positive bacteria)]